MAVATYFLVVTDQMLTAAPALSVAGLSLVGHSPEAMTTATYRRKLTVWTFPDRQGFDEQAILFEQGGDSILYGNTAGRSY